MVEQNKFKKRRIFSSEKCSLDFRTHFSVSASVTVECEACGRYHFSDAGEIDKDELDRLQGRADGDPDGFIFHPTDMIQWTTFGGREIAFDCICNYAKLLEEGLCNYQSRVLEFFKSRTEKQLVVAQQNKNQLDDALKVIEN